SGSPPGLETCSRRRERIPCTGPARDRGARVDHRNTPANPRKLRRPRRRRRLAPALSAAARSPRRDSVGTPPPGTRRCSATVAPERGRQTRRAKAVWYSRAGTAVPTDQHGSRDHLIHLFAGAHPPTLRLRALSSPHVVQAHANVALRWTIVFTSQ